MAEIEQLDTGRETTVKSVAILPFMNMSPDPENEYFSDGMTEEIISALSRLEGLRVAARSSSFSFKNRLIDVAEVGGKLKVDAILEGSVRKAGKKLRITAQLIDVAEGYHLWSGRYDREMGDVFTIQEDIAAAIVQHLAAALGEQGPIVTPSMQSLEAYEFYLQGRFPWNRRHLRQSIDCFEKAIALEPAHALSHAGLADAYALLGFANGGRPNDVMPRAKRPPRSGPSPRPTARQASRRSRRRRCPLPESSRICTTRDDVIGDGDARDPRVSGYRSAHARPPELANGCPRSAGASRSVPWLGSRDC